MGSALSQLSGEGIVGWVILLAVAISGLCVLSLATMMIVGKWRHAVRQRRRNRTRRNAPPS